MDANALTRAIHDRMPVLLGKADFEPLAGRRRRREASKANRRGSLSHVARIEARQQDRQR